MLAVLTRTLNHAKAVSEPIDENPLRYPAKAMELKIVQSMQDILNPKITIFAEKMSL